MRHRSIATLIVVVTACGGKAAAPTGGHRGDHAVVAEDPLPCTGETAAGSWSTVLGADFEEITLEADGTFVSHLHARPFYVGTWAITDGALVLSAEGDTTIRIDGARCASRLTGDSEGATVEWTRI